jgi:hypothetical protein
LELADVSTRHLNQTELSARWNLSPRTLERWRWLGEGPRYLKLGGRVLYRVEDVEAFESTNAVGTSGQIPAQRPALLQPPGTPARHCGGASARSA